MTLHVSFPMYPILWVSWMTLPHVSFPMYPISLVTAGRWGYVLCDVLCACRHQSLGMGGWVFSECCVAGSRYTILFQRYNRFVFIEDLDAEIEWFGNEHWFSVRLWFIWLDTTKTIGWLVIRNLAGLDHTWVVDHRVAIGSLFCYQIPLPFGVAQCPMLVNRVHTRWCAVLPPYTVRSLRLPLISSPYYHMCLVSRIRHPLMPDTCSTLYCTQPAWQPHWASLRIERQTSTITELTTYYVVTWRRHIRPILHPQHWLLLTGQDAR